LTTLTHYADRPRTLDRGRRYEQLPPESFTHKPRGIWVSVDGEDDWHSWCTDNSFNLGGLTQAHRVTLTDDANVLWITNRQEFVAFAKGYGRPEERPLFTAMRRVTEVDYETAISWGRVATDYDGIIIAPYQWHFRLSCMWYYGWDCASGCIWNLDAIAEFTPIPGDTKRFRELIDEEEASNG
jgi:hypothetical protein